MIEALDLAQTRALDRLGELRAGLMAATSMESTKAPPPWPTASFDVRANAIVYAMAELEALITAIIRIAHVSINAEGVQVRDCVPGLRRLLAHDRFQALRDLSDPEKMWPVRLYTTTLEECVDIAALSVVAGTHAPPPLDGKTPTVRHFALMWSVYELPGDPFPFPACNGTLKKLAIARNDLAHGNVPYNEFFSGKGYSFPDLNMHLSNLEKLIQHVVQAWDLYLSTSAYRRVPAT